ncbi:MAG TPA: FtsX-like permease family protein [Pyrinomonadaceae bacterium]|nr:FtsX-like permease family protein [Pyrinomonadaceae bacterium]
MLFELKLARAFLLTRRRSLARFTAAVAVVTLAVGVAALIVAQAIGNGFRNELQTKILANTAHIAVFIKDGSRIENWKRAISEIEGIKNVKSVSTGAYESAVLLGDRATEYAVLKTDDVAASNAGQKIAVAVGSELAERSGVTPGSEVRLVVFDDNGQTRQATVVVSGTFATGLYEYDSTWIRISPSDLAQLRGEPAFTPSVINASLDDMFRSDDTAHEMRKALGEGYRVIDWQEANRPLFAALSAERRAGTAVILLIIVIAAINITTTLALIVNERRADIAVLKTCGIKGRNIVSLFIVQGSLLAAGGIAAGVIIGIVACAFANHFELLRLPADVYSINYIPLRIEPFSVALTAAAAFVISVAATLYPAIRASGARPLELLRTQ